MDLQNFSSNLQAASCESSAAQDCPIHLLQLPSISLWPGKQYATELLIVCSFYQSNWKWALPTSCALSFALQFGKMQWVLHPVLTQTGGVSSYNENSSLLLSLPDGPSWESLSFHSHMEISMTRSWFDAVFYLLVDCI